jgi:surface antigen
VNGDGSYTISEMNYVGFGVVNTRTIHPGTTSTIGFVY